MVGLVGQLNDCYGKHIMMWDRNGTRLVSGWVVKAPSRDKVKLSLEHPGKRETNCCRPWPTRGNRTYSLREFDKYMIIGEPTIRFIG